MYLPFGYPASEEAPTSAEEVSHAHPEGEAEPRVEAEESQQEETEEDEHARWQRIEPKIAGTGCMRFDMLLSHAAPLDDHAKKNLNRFVHSIWPHCPGHVALHGSLYFSSGYA